MAAICREERSRRGPGKTTTSVRTKVRNRPLSRHSLVVARGSQMRRQRTSARGSFRNNYAASFFQSTPPSKAAAAR
jgi:hypothetical protein